MLDLVSLILFFFSLLATILTLFMAAIAILILLAVFLFVAVTVGLQKNSIFKGLKVFIVATSILLITPTISILFAKNFSSVLHFSSTSLFIIGGVIGFVLSLLFSKFSLALFEKFAERTYKSIKKE